MKGSPAGRHGEKQGERQGERRGGDDGRREKEDFTETGSGSWKS